MIGEDEALQALDPTGKGFIATYRWGLRSRRVSPQHRMHLAGG